MPINLIVNGVGYSYPVSGDDGWAEGATNWANAVTQNLASLNTVLASVSSGIFSLANGAVGTPSLRFTNSPTTGLYRIGVNVIGFSSNGVNTGSISAAGLWTLGASGGTQIHAVNGDLAITGDLSATDLTLSGSFTAANISGTNTGDVTLGSFGSSPNSKGLSLSGQVLTLQPADASHPGAISTSTQTLAGAKTLTDDLSINSNDIILDADGTGAQNTAILQGTSTNRFGLSANSVQGNGGELYLYGPNHATDGQVVRIASNGNFVVQVDDTSGLQVLRQNLAVSTAGKGLQIKEGSNAKMGTATLTSGGVTVSNTSVTANSRIFLTSQVDGGNTGFLRVSARTAGTSFTISSSNSNDSSTVAYLIVEPA